MFEVSVAKGSKFQQVLVENVGSLPELKSFLYSIREARGLHAMVTAQNGAIVVQESGIPLRTWGKGNDPRDVELLNRLKKSTYHPEGKMVS